MRRRMLNPDFFTDPDIVANFDFAGRLFYQGLWCIAEDSGCFEMNTLLLKMKIFPGDNIELDIIQGYIEKLMSLKKVIAYEVDGKKYGWIKNFLKHQRLDRPSEPSVPLPPWICWHGEEEFGDKRHKYYYEILPLDNDCKDKSPTCRGQQTSKDTIEKKLIEEKRTEDILSSEPAGSTTTDEDEKVKFDKNSKEYKIAVFMRSKLLEIKPDSKVPSSDVKGLQKWCQDIDYMIRLDKRDPKDIIKLFKWSQENSFWCANIRSPAKLREKWDTVDLQMRQKSEKKGNSGRKNKFHNFSEREYDFDDLEKKIQERNLKMFAEGG